MFDEYLKREDVKRFLLEIRYNDCYFLKDMRQFSSYSFYMSKELSLYIFYDALYKFHLIIKDMKYFPGYLEQLDRLYKKIDSFDELEHGISKLICKIVSNQIHVHNMNQVEEGKKIITVIYHNYVEEGYFIHGFHPVYYNYIINNGFIPEVYNNYYLRFIQLNKILRKYGINPIMKDFTSNKVSYTDDFVMGCYYSTYAPNYFYQFIRQCRIFHTKRDDEAYLMDRYSIIERNLKFFMKYHLFSKEDSEFVLKLVKEQWDLIHQRKGLSLMFVKRRKILPNEIITLDDYLFDDKNIYEVVDRIMNSKQNNILSNEMIDSSSFQVLFIDSNGLNSKKEKKENRFHSHSFLNAYGSASILFIMGSMLITLGVIISIFMMMGE
ncbi:MAG: hypothetical protein IKE70_06005 [Bacilli bacterium]|nr:hypothetical protein [Bacilli bacterium]